MRKINDQLLARRLLNIRDQGGFGFGTFLRMNIRKHVLIIAYFGAALGLLAALNWWALFAFMLGMLVGTVARDYGWVRSSGKTWPFTKKVTNWEIVEELAAAEPAYRQMPGSPDSR